MHVRQGYETPEEREEEGMPTIKVTPEVVRGSIGTYRTLVFFKHCIKCHRFVFIGNWFIHEQRTEYRNGTQVIEREFYCPNEPEADKL